VEVATVKVQCTHIIFVMNEISSKANVCNAVLLCLHAAPLWLRTERALDRHSSGILQSKTRENVAWYRCAGRHLTWQHLESGGGF